MLANTSAGVGPLHFVLRFSGAYAKTIFGPTQAITDCLEFLGALCIKTFGTRSGLHRYS